MHSESRFDPEEIKKLFRPEGLSKNGQVTIIGGSSLFHGAPIFSLTASSRVNDMVFFASPEKTTELVAAQIKSRLSAFIWVPWDEVDDYIEKSDAVLIGPGLMRYRTEKNENQNPETKDEASELTYDVTTKLLKRFPQKKWVIDAGSLQVIKGSSIPEGSIITPNQSEYKILFGNKDPKVVSKSLNCTILLKDTTDKVYSEGRVVVVEGGNAGLSKGGTGDTLAGLVVSLFAKNDADISAAAASYVIKKTAEKLFDEVGPFYNSDDLSSRVANTFWELSKE